MGFMPAPQTIPKTPGQLAAEAESDPNEQVTPYMPNPNLFARYQILQNGNEVGWVYVSGQSGTSCGEHWQLYNVGTTGQGSTLPDGTTPTRAGYVWPSLNNNQAESTDVILRIVFIGSVSQVMPPPNLSPNSYTQITAQCQ